MTSCNKNTIWSLICSRGGPRDGPPHPPTLGAPRGTRGAPRSPARSSILAHVEPVDHVAVLAQDRRAPDLVGPRQLVVVGVQLLVEQREGMDPGRPRQVLVHPRHFPPEARRPPRSEEHTSELQSLAYLVCRLLLEKK